eukprot:6067554-Alexandrium_andersonii.AAC.1
MALLSRACALPLSAAVATARAGLSGSRLVLARLAGLAVRLAASLSAFAAGPGLPPRLGVVDCGSRRRIHGCLCSAAP